MSHSQAGAHGPHLFVSVFVYFCCTEVSNSTVTVYSKSFLRGKKEYRKCVQRFIYKFPESIQECLVCDKKKSRSSVLTEEKLQVLRQDET
jgi:hypothetical protein